MQEQLLQLLLSLTEGRTDDAERTLRGLGTVDDDFDAEELRRGIVEFASQFQDASLGNVAVGKVFLGLVRAAGEGGLHLPSELTMLGKTLLHLDHVATTLSPGFRPNDVIRREAAELMRRRIGTSLSFGRFLNVLLESKSFLEKLPKRANDILDLASRNELKLNVQAIDERVLVEGFQKMANRIATGLVLAALIVGASMLMQVETTFRILGYPGFAMICFLGAAMGGVSLLFSILRSDRHG
jgi:predicted unusual protein kinase regulating ubiquinone biosynthesis (AarF/ABC1/UbiB family)